MKDFKIEIECVNNEIMFSNTRDMSFGELHTVFETIIHSLIDKLTQEN